MAEPPTGIPWRGPGSGRPDLPLPPGRMPLLRGGRPLKHWRWVGAFGPEVMACAAYVRVGVVPVAWWAVWDGTELKDRTYRRGGPVRVEPGVCRAPGIELELEEGPGIEVVSPHGSQYIYTHKQGSVPMRGTVAGRPFAGFGFIDDSAGYHARRTSWRWSAGVGVARSGARIAWNLVDGVHDDPAVSERTVWVEGEPHEIGPVRFADDLSGVGGLQFTRLAARSRRENMLLMSSDYEQPFGIFSGVLPVVGALEEGWGVMERHDVRW
jgi:Protein of unknown function (DUF2804)